MPGTGLTALDAESGRERWSASASHAIQGVAVADRPYAGIASNGGGRSRPESAPVFLADRVLVAGANTGVWALDPVTGAELWYAGELGDDGSAPVVAGGRLFYRAWTDSEVAVLG